MSVFGDITTELSMGHLGKIFIIEACDTYIHWKWSAPPRFPLSFKGLGTLAVLAL
jgi:hypothetical protein